MKWRIVVVLLGGDLVEVDVNWGRRLDMMENE